VSWSIAITMRVGALRLDVDLSGDEAPVALIGPNGSGKTTLLRTIAGAHRPDTGVIRLDGRAVFDSKSGLDLPPEERGTGYVPQGYGLFPHLNVLDNVAFGADTTGGAHGMAQRRGLAEAVLDQLGCLHLSDRSPRALSGGEQQRVALARALLREPKILLLDEPLGALDALARKSIRTFLAHHLARHSRAALVVSHEARDVRELGATVHVLEDGRIVQSGTADELAAAPATPFVEAFFDA